MDAMTAGATSRASIALRAGLDPDVVDAAVEELTRLGVLRAEDLTTTCPTDGCSGCAAPTGHGCSSPGRGPVLLSLSPIPTRHANGHR